MRETRFTELVGCEVPLQLAGMGLISAPELATAVAHSGGLGMLAMPMVPAPALEEMLAALPDPGPGAFGVNFLMPFLDLDCVKVSARAVRVVEFFYGDPDPSLVESGHEGGALVSWQVGSSEEAVAAERAGCDFVIAQGTEAGGHVRGKLPLRALLERVVDVLKVPVVAAGGIATADDVAAAIATGASAVRVGTRFVAAAEADAHPDYVEALISAHAEDTVITEAFSVMWPDAPHRVLRSSIERAQSIDEDVVGEIAVAGAKMPIPRLSPIAPTRGVTGDVSAMPLYAGESVDAVTYVQPAAEIVRELTAGLG